MSYRMNCSRMETICAQSPTACPAGETCFRPDSCWCTEHLSRSTGRLIQEVRRAIADPDRADAVLALLALMQGKAVNWNSMLSSWNVGAQSTRSAFDRHDFSFKWTFAEFEGARELYPWALNGGILRAYRGLVELLGPTGEGGLLEHELEHPVPGPVTVSREMPATSSRWRTDRSSSYASTRRITTTSCMPSWRTYFYVWEKRTLGLLWPELFVDELTNKDDEAVANPGPLRSMPAAGGTSWRLSTTSGR